MRTTRARTSTMSGSVAPTYMAGADEGEGDAPIAGSVPLSTLGGEGGEEVEDPATTSASAIQITARRSRSADTSMRHQVWASSDASLHQAHRSRRCRRRRPAYASAERAAADDDDDARRSRPGAASAAAGTPRSAAACRRVTPPATRATAAEPVAVSGQEHRRRRCRPRRRRPAARPTRRRGAPAAARGPTPAVETATTATATTTASIGLGAQPALARPQHRRRTVGDLELGEDRRQVVAHRLGRQVQRRGDLGRTPSLREEAEDVAFARGQLRERLVGRDLAPGVGEVLAAGARRCRARRSPGRGRPP